MHRLVDLTGRLLAMVSRLGDLASEERMLFTVAHVDGADIGGVLPLRIARLVGSQWRLRRRLGAFAAEARAAGVSATDVSRVVALARRSYRLAMQLAHYDDLRNLLSTWRWLHRWLALLLGALLVVHVVAAVRYGGVDFGVWFGGGAG